MEALAQSGLAPMGTDLLAVLLEHVADEDALCAALACKPFRDALFARYGVRPLGEPHAGLRFVTGVAAVAASGPRLGWARGLGAAGPGWLHRWDEGTTAALGGVGSLPGLRWAREGEDPCAMSDSFSVAAARGGHLECLRYGKDIGRYSRDASSATCVAACMGGHLDCLQWALSTRTESGYRKIDPGAWAPSLIAATAWSGHLDVVHWLHETYGANEPRQTSACESAARAGRVDMLRWLHERDFPWDEKTCALAAHGGHLECLRFAREVVPPCDWDATTCHEAAVGGRMECIRYAHEKLCPWDAPTCALAARFGQLEMLQWLREHHCPWDKMTCTFAVRGGHVAVLRWARDHHCEWEDGHGIILHGHLGIWDEAAEAGSMDCLRYVHDSGATPHRISDPEPCSHAAQRGHLDVLVYLRSLPIPYPWDADTSRRAAANGQLRCLQFMHRQISASVSIADNCPWSVETCAFAARYGHLECLKYVRGLDPPCPWDDTTIGYALYGMTTIWLVNSPADVGYENSQQCYEWARANNAPGNEVLTPLWALADSDDY
jgi:hypothetical protein